MSRYFVRRLLLVVPVLFGVSVFTFILFFIVPGDPVLVRGGRTGNARNGGRASGRSSAWTSRCPSSTCLGGQGAQRRPGPVVHDSRSITDSIQARFP